MGICTLLSRELNLTPQRDGEARQSAQAGRALPLSTIGPRLESARAGARAGACAPSADKELDPEDPNVDACPMRGRGGEARRGGGGVHEFRGGTPPLPATPADEEGRRTGRGGVGCVSSGSATPVVTRGQGIGTRESNKKSLS